MMFIIFGHLFGITGLKKNKILYKNVSKQGNVSLYLACGMRIGEFARRQPKPWDRSASHSRKALDRRHE